MCRLQGWVYVAGEVLICTTQVLTATLSAASRRGCHEFFRRYRMRSSHLSVHPRVRNLSHGSCGVLSARVCPPSRGIDCCLPKLGSSSRRLIPAVAHLLVIGAMKSLRRPMLPHKPPLSRRVIERRHPHPEQRDRKMQVSERHSRYCLRRGTGTGGDSVGVVAPVAGIVPSVWNGAIAP